MFSVLSDQSENDLSLTFYNRFIAREQTQSHLHEVL